MKLLLKYSPLIMLISLVIQITSFLESLDYRLLSLRIYSITEIEYPPIEYLPVLVFILAFLVLAVLALLPMSERLCDRFHFGCYKGSDGKWYLDPY